MIVQKIKQDIQKFRIERNKLYQQSLQSVVAEFDRAGKDIDDTKAVKIIKQSIENLKQCNKLKPNPEYESEISLLEQYIPQQMTSDELYSILNDKFNSGMTEIRDLMKYLKDNYSGQYDGKLASFVIQNLKKD